MERGYNALFSKRLERECSVEEIHRSFKRNNCLLTMRFMLLNSRAHGVSGNNERPSQTPRRSRPCGTPHAMTEVSILLSVIHQIGRNIASIFCHQIIKKFPAEPLAATRGTPVE